MYAYCNDNPVFYKDTTGNKIVAVPLEGGGKPSKIKYDVPVYDQGAWSLCWAFCQIMVESYWNKETLSNWEATKRAINLSKKINSNAWWIWDWNVAGTPENIKIVATPKDIYGLRDILLKYGPVYARYCKEDEDTAHLIVVTGVDTINDIVYTNNPWGIKGEQTFEEFKSGFVYRWYQYFDAKGYELKSLKVPTGRY